MKERIKIILPTVVLTTSAMYIFLRCSGFIGVGPMLDNATINSESNQKTEIAVVTVVNDEISSEIENRANSSGFTFEKKLNFSAQTQTK